MNLKRVVLDTNVCLDLFLFHDPRCASLMSALLSKEIEAVTRLDCRMEWQIVLGYPHLQLNLERQKEIAANFDRLIDCMPAEHLSTLNTPLPICTDRDDQKFLELTRDAQAAVLITKDKALLKLAKRTRRVGLFQIMTPVAWNLAQPHRETQDPSCANL